MRQKVFQPLFAFILKPYDIFFVTAFTDNVHMDAHSYENTTEKNGYNYTFRQLPPMNSLRIEVFGITSLSMARK